jgi:hypothetical protein
MLGCRNYFDCRKNSPFHHHISFIRGGISSIRHEKGMIGYGNRFVGHKNSLFPHTNCFVRDGIISVRDGSPLFHRGNCLVGKATPDNLCSDCKPESSPTRTGVGCRLVEME